MNILYYICLKVISRNERVREKNESGMRQTETYGRKDFTEQ